MPDAVGVTHHVRLDGKYFLIRRGSYIKSSTPLVGPLPPGTAGVDITPQKTWHQESWIGGLGQELATDPAMYKEGFVDSYSHPHELRCLQRAVALTNSTAFLGGADSWPFFEVRSLSETDQPRLYAAVRNLSGSSNVGKGQVYRFREDLNSGNLHEIFSGAATTSNPRAIYNSWRNNPFRLAVAMVNGKVHTVGGGTETVNTASSLKDFGATGHVAAMRNFNSADYYGVSHGTSGARVFRDPPTTIEQFHDCNQLAFGGFAIWNSRLWFIAATSEGTSKLWVTDGTVVNMAYEWSSSFYATSIHAHGGNLFIGGQMQRYNDTASIGQVWRYNGASMDLVGQFDDTAGVTNYPRFPTTSGEKHFTIYNLASWGKFLAVPNAERSLSDGTKREGVVFYDPEEDAWHYGTYIPTADYNASFPGQVVALRDYDGRLMIGARNTGKIHYINNEGSSFTKSQYVSSVFTAGTRGTDKLFSSVRVRTTSRKYTRLTVEYTTDEGATWTNLGNIDGPTTDTSVTTETTFTLGTNLVGVTARSLGLRITFSPGDSAAVSYGGETGNRTAKVHSHDVEWDWAPIPRHTWSFTLHAEPFLVGPDGTRDARTGEQITDELWAIVNGNKTVKFQDIDEEWWLVQVRAGNEYQQIIRHQDTDGLQAEFPITLQEWKKLSSDGSTVVQ